VVAQIYGVGLITTRLTGVAFESACSSAWRHSGVLLPGRHARGDLDAGGAVHHPDHCLHDPGGVAVGEADGVPVPQAIYGYQLQKVTARGRS
jgi:cation/acetate symporter